MRSSKKDSGKPDSPFKASYRRMTVVLPILHLLSERPMYAYQLGQEMAARSGERGYTKILLYKTLYDMEEAGYIRQGEMELSERNQIRAYYEITESGKEHLKELLADYEDARSSLDKILNQPREDDVK